MASKKRDYKKEYARRVALGKTRNISKSQARGHARVKYSESSIKQLREAGNVSVKERIEEQIKKFYAVVNRVTKGESLTSATKQEHLSRQTFDRLNGEYGNYLGKTYKESSKGGKAVHAGYALSNEPAKSGEIAILVDMGSGKPELRYIVAVGVERSHIGTYWNLVDAAKKTGNSFSLKAFRFNPIHDVNGNTYTLVTSLNKIYQWDGSLTAEQERQLHESIYRAIKAAA